MTDDVPDYNPMPPISSRTFAMIAPDELATLRRELDESRKREAAMREFARELLGFLKRIGWTREFAQDLVDGKECFAVDDDLGRELLRILAGTPEGGKVTP